MSTTQINMEYPVILSSLASHQHRKHNVCMMTTDYHSIITLIIGIQRTLDQQVTNVAALTPC